MVYTPPKLSVDSNDGHLNGSRFISYNRPFPTVEGTPGGSGAMMGVVMHTMVGSYGGTISWFNNAEAEASAFFAVSNEGLIHQFGPVGKNWMAWAQADGNPNWYSIEFEDDMDPTRPLTNPQINASAQIVQCLAAFAGFPLDITDSVDKKGFGIHSMGGVPWGDHPDCPGSVRANQRQAILDVARRIGEPAPSVTEPADQALLVLPTLESRRVTSVDGGKLWA